MWPQWVQPYPDKELRKQWRLLEEKANYLQVIIDWLQPMARDEGASCSGEEEPLQVMKVWRKHALSSGNGQKWPPSPVSRPMTKKLKMGDDLVKDLHGEERSWWKKLAPRKRTSPSADVVRIEEGPNQLRARTSEQRIQQYHPGTVALQQIHQYQKTTDLLIQKLPFSHLVWELSQKYHPLNLVMEYYCRQGSSIGGLQEARKYMLVGLLEDANLCNSCVVCHYPTYGFAVGSAFVRASSH